MKKLMSSQADQTPTKKRKKPSSDSHDSDSDSLSGSQRRLPASWTAKATPSPKKTKPVVFDVEDPDDDFTHRPPLYESPTKPEKPTEVENKPEKKFDEEDFRQTVKHLHTFAKAVSDPSTWPCAFNFISSIHCKCH
jgi:hypothetical protein